MRRSDAVAVELFDVELLNAVKQYGITTADRRAVKLAGTADKRRGARYHDLIGIGKLGTGNIALDDRNTVFAAETDKMAACDTGEDKVSERCGDKLTVLENRDVGMCPRSRRRDTRYRPPRTGGVLSEQPRRSPRRLQPERREYSV